MVENDVDVEYDLIRVQSINTTAALQSELGKISSKEERIKQAYINGIDSIDEYKKNKTDLQSRRAEIERSIAAEENIIRPDSSAFRGTVRDVLDVIENDASFEKKAEALRSCVSYITFYKIEQRIEMHYYVTY